MHFSPQDPPALSGPGASEGGSTPLCAWEGNSTELRPRRAKGPQATSWLRSLCLGLPTWDPRRGSQILMRNPGEFQKDYRSFTEHTLQTCIVTEIVKTVQVLLDRQKAEHTRGAQARGAPAPAPRKAELHK